MDADIESFNQEVSQDSSTNCLIVHKTIQMDFSPEQAARALNKENAHLALLSFNAGSDKHYSFVGFNPLINLVCKDNVSHITKGKKTTESTASPFQLITELQQTLNPKITDKGTRLTACPIAIMAYDAVRYIEDLKCAAKPKDTPDLEVNFYEYGIYFNYKENTITLSRCIQTSVAYKKLYNEAMESLESVIETIVNYDLANPETTKTKEQFSLNMTDDKFKEEINKAKKFIKQGEIFQLVLSRAYTKKFDQDPLNLYQTLLTTNPSPYHFCIKTPGYTLVAASPEKIVNVCNKTITSTPLAGTKPIEGDLNAVINTLLKDEKEIAEHMMLVDLARNDLGKVSVPGSVNVAKLTYPLVLKNIVHLASTVEGTLDSNHNSLDALLASFPAGTLSGAPKIRAMQLIEKLETKNRGFYGGCVFTLDHFDNLESCIIIRHAEIVKGTIKIQSGSGIVFDSDPQAECLETKNKAKAMLNAVNLCETGDLL